MTPSAKRLLATTIQALRARLLVELHDATESAYQLSIPRVRDASLSEANRVRRARLEGWPRLREDVEKTAAHTLINRLVLLLLMEAGRRSTAQVVTGGWVVGDPSEGYAFLLQMLFEELAGELPGLFGTNQVSDLVPVRFRP